MAECFLGTAVSLTYILKVADYKIEVDWKLIWFHQEKERECFWRNGIVSSGNSGGCGIAQSLL